MVFIYENNFDLSAESGAASDPPPFSFHVRAFRCAGRCGVLAFLMGLNPLCIYGMPDAAKNSPAVVRRCPLWAVNYHSFIPTAQKLLTHTVFLGTPTAVHWKAACWLLPTPAPRSRSREPGGQLLTEDSPCRAPSLQL